MKTRYIVLIDFSNTSIVLMKLAAEWSKHSDAEILFVHQVPGIVPALSDDNSRQAIIEVEKKEAYRQLKELAGKSLVAGANTTLIITETHLITYLPQIINPLMNNVIFLGAKRKSLIEQMFIGSTAIKVVDNLNNTVVVVPEETNGMNNNIKVIVATNYKFAVNEKAFVKFLTNLKSIIKEVEFISVLNKDEIEADSLNYLTGLNDKYKNHFNTSIKLIKGKDLNEEVINYLKSTPDHILVVQKGSRSISDHLFRKFFINDLINEGSSLLVILPL